MPRGRCWKGSCTRDHRGPREKARQQTSLRERPGATRAARGPLPRRGSGMAQLTTLGFALGYQPRSR